MTTTNRIFLSFAPLGDVVNLASFTDDKWYPSHTVALSSKIADMLEKVNEHLETTPADANQFILAMDDGTGNPLVLDKLTGAWSFNEVDSPSKITIT